MDGNQNQTVKEEFVGVKGWLLFFAIIFTFLFPFLTINRLFLPIFASSESPFLYKINETSVGLFSLLTGISIFFKSSKTKILLQIFLLFYLINSITIHPLNNDIKGLPIKNIYAIAVVTIVYLYFKNSERVKNTLVN